MKKVYSFMGMGPFSYVGGCWEEDENKTPEENCKKLIGDFLSESLAPWSDGSSGFFSTYYDTQKYTSKIKTFPHSTPLEWLKNMEKAGFIDSLDCWEE